MYTKLIEKPYMKEKLLQRPPFRFLHDIFVATMHKTGFGRGLFEGHQLNSKDFKDDPKGQETALFKVIALTEEMMHEDLSAKDLPA